MRGERVVCLMCVKAKIENRLGGKRSYSIAHAESNSATVLQSKQTLHVRLATKVKFAGSRKPNRTKKGGGRDEKLRHNER